MLYEVSRFHLRGDNDVEAVRIPAYSAMLLDEDAAKHYLRLITGGMPAWVKEHLDIETLTRTKLDDPFSYKSDECFSARFIDVFADGVKYDEVAFQHHVMILNKKDYVEVMDSTKFHLLYKRS